MPMLRFKIVNKMPHIIIRNWILEMLIWKNFQSLIFDSCTLNESY